MKLEATGRVYLLYSPATCAVLMAFANNGLFWIETLDVPARGEPNDDLIAIQALAVAALERGDIVFDEEMSEDDDRGDPVAIRQTIAKLLQIPIPVHESVPRRIGSIPSDRIWSMAFQPLERGEVLIIIQPFCSFDDENLFALLPKPVPAVARRTGNALPEEPPPLAKPATVSNFEITVILCQETATRE